MNKLLLIGLVTLPLSVQAVEKDKQFHLGVSAVLGAGLQYHTDDWVTSMTACSLVGLGKEIYDEYDYGGFDTEDLAYDVVGCGLGVVVGDYGLYLFGDQDAKGVGYKFEF